MSTYLRSTFTIAVAVALAVAISTGPIRAADGSKALRARVRALEATVAELEAKLTYMRVEQDPDNGLAGPHVIFEGCNVHVRSGSGDSTDGTFDLTNRTLIPDTTPLGLGNLVLGYDEAPIFGEGPSRGGSHNLIVGPGHNFSSVGGVLFGQENKVTAPLASVTGGYLNLASGIESSVSGGFGNTAQGATTNVSGGYDNNANGIYSSVAGGFQNDAFGGYSTISGGYGNKTIGDYSSVSGGSVHTTQGNFDWAAGALFQDF